MSKEPKLINPRVDVGRPIRPHEVSIARGIPLDVIAAFNTLIVTHWNGHEARFTQEDVVQMILLRLGETARSRIFEEHWLDVEQAYREAGWNVTYDKPGYNESYEPSFVFRKVSP